MSKFKVGDKVRCVSVVGPSGGVLTLDAIYTVAEVDETAGHEQMVRVNDHPVLFFASRFELVPVVTEFKVGDKAKCIDGTGFVGLLAIGAVYKIDAVAKYSDGLWVRVGSAWFHARRFEKIAEAASRYYGSVGMPAPIDLNGNKLIAPVLAKVAPEDYPNCRSSRSQILRGYDESSEVGDRIFGSASIGDPLKDEFVDARGNVWVPDPNGTHCRWTTWVASVLNQWDATLVQHGDRQPSGLGVEAVFVRYRQKTKNNSPMRQTLRDAGFVVDAPAKPKMSPPFPLAERGFLHDDFRFVDMEGTSWVIDGEGDHGIWASWTHNEIFADCFRPEPMGSFRVTIADRHMYVSGKDVYYRCRKLGPKTIAVVKPRVVETKWGPIEVERHNADLAVLVYDDGVERIRVSAIIPLGSDPEDPNFVARVIADHESLVDNNGENGVEDVLITMQRIREAQQQEQAEVESKKLPGPGTDAEWGEP